MEVVVTSFINPFLFYCVPKTERLDENIESICLTDNAAENKLNKTKFEVSDVNHGQYIAVMWKNKWTRGIVTMETQFLIWLIDYGIFLRPSNKTVYIDLPPDYRKYPSKVFEASLHGVTPVDKVLTHDCRIKNVVSSVWNKGVSEKAQSLIKNAKKTFFSPLALLSTGNNDVILGELYLETYDNQSINLVDELEVWPVFLEKNKEAYIKSLSNFYINRRKHRACLLKPDIASKLPIMTLETSIDDYIAICAKNVELTQQKESDTCSEDGSTVLDMKYNFIKEKETYKLTHEEIKKYANMYVRVHGQDFNVLNVLINKIRDLNICERYKDHELKSIGCCISVRKPNLKN